MISPSARKVVDLSKILLVLTWFKIKLCCKLQNQGKLVTTHENDEV